MALGKILVVIGAVFVIVGLMIVYGFRLPGFGKLPGDIILKKEGFSFYFPIVTCILISLILTLIVTIVRWFR